MAIARQSKTPKAGAQSPHSEAPSPDGPADGPHGTQLIARAAGMLKLLSSGKAEGMRLSDLERRSGLSQPTVHRILRGLMASELVTQDAESRLYSLGPLCHELGLAARPRFDLQGLARHAVERLAQRTGDTVYLSLRSGLDTVCVDRQEGGFTIRVFTIALGDRRPLGVGSGSLALLAALDDAEVETVLERNAPRYAAYRGLDLKTLRTLIGRVRKRGYAINNVAITPGVASIGVAVRDDRGVPIGGIGVATIDSRIDGVRIDSLAAALHDAARAIQKRFVEVRQESRTRWR